MYDQYRGNDVTDYLRFTIFTRQSAYATVMDRTEKKPRFLSKVSRLSGLLGF